MDPRIGVSAGVAAPRAAGNLQVIVATIEIAELSEVRLRVAPFSIGTLFRARAVHGPRFVGVGVKRVQLAGTEPLRQTRGARSCLQDLSGVELHSELHPPDAPSLCTSQMLRMVKLIIAGASLLPADIVIVRVPDEDNNLRLIACTGTDALPPLLSAGTAFSGLAAENRAAVVSIDCYSDPRLTSTGTKMAHDAAMRSFVAVPIGDSSKMVGVLGVGTHRPTRFGHSQIERLSYFANEAASALQDAPSRDYIDRLLARHERAADDLGARLARIERALAVRDAPARALEETPVHEVDTCQSKRGYDLANSARASKPGPLPSPAEHLLFEGYRSGALASFIDDALEPLLKEDERHGLELVATLACYFQNSCNISKTARQLFVHMNTVRHRLLKCEDLGHFSLEDADTRFHLQIALRVARLAGRCTF